MKTHLQDILKRMEYLNKIIDRKIIAGFPYKREAQEHKALLYYLKANS